MVRLRLSAMTNTLKFRTELPASARVTRAIGIRGLLAISGSTIHRVVADEEGNDVGLLIPLVGQRRALVIRLDPQYLGFWSVKLIQPASGLNSTRHFKPIVHARLSRVPLDSLLDVAIEAATTGKMEAF